MRLISVIACLALAGCSTVKDWFKPDEPKKVVVDPDVRTLMLNRKLAEADVTGVTQATSPTSAR